MRFLISLSLAASLFTFAMTPAVAQPVRCAEPVDLSDAFVRATTDDEKRRFLYDTFKDAPRIFMILSMVAEAKYPRLEAILKEGDSPNVCGPLGASPLIFMASTGDWRAAEQLLKYGAEVDSPRTGVGTTALFTAIGSGHLAFARQLLAAGADAKVEADGGVTVLFDIAVLPHNRQYAKYSAYDQTRLAKTLIDAGAPINKQFYSGATALMMAAMQNNADLVKLFIASGANVNLKNKRGKSALTYAQEKKYHDIVKLLLDAGAIDDAGKSEKP